MARATEEFFTSEAMAQRDDALFQVVYHLGNAVELRMGHGAPERQTDTCTPSSLVHLTQRPVPPPTALAGPTTGRSLASRPIRPSLPRGGRPTCPRPGYLSRLPQRLVLGELLRREHGLQL